MKITIENCNNIDSGTIEIEPNKLNIKYANNGTGKSSIANSIKAFATNDQEKKNMLIPYKYMGKAAKPNSNVTGIDDIHTVEIFDDKYVNQFLFQKDKASKEEVLINDSFSIFIKTPEYDENMKKIKDQLQSITQTIQEHEKLNSIIDLFNNFLKKCGTGKGIARNSDIAKADLSTGNKLVKIAPQYEKYTPFLQDRENFNNANWLAWVNNGINYMKDRKICPFCLSPVQEENIDSAKALVKEFDEKKIAKLTDVLDVFKKIRVYLNNDSQEFLERIENEGSGLDDEKNKKLTEIKAAVNAGLDSLQKLKRLTPYSLNDIDDLIKNIEEKTLDFTRIGNGILNSDQMNEIADIMNNMLKEVSDKAKDIKNSLDEQKSIIQNTIETNKTNINAFLKSAGYNYEVDINQKDDTANIYLKPIGVNRVVDNAKEHLSYGERNAFAMVLFMYSAISKNPDLIILDDPISSFDGNKKFALLNMMFLLSQSNDPGAGVQNEKAMLQGKTVLLLTHDFSTVLDIVHTLHRCFPDAQAHFLKNTEGELSEQRIKNDDFKSVLSITDKMIKIADDNLIKAVHLRRFLELRGEKEDAYNMLSSLLHKRLKPTNRQGHEMDPDGYARATEHIRQYIEGFDYETEVRRVRNDDILREIYRNATDYEKVLVFRIFMGDDRETTNNVLQKYINELFHVENDSIYQLVPTTFSNIPQYIIDECDNIMGCPKSSPTNS